MSILNRWTQTNQNPWNTTYQFQAGRNFPRLEVFKPVDDPMQWHYSLGGLNSIEGYPSPEDAMWSAIAAALNHINQTRESLQNAEIDLVLIAAEQPDAPKPVVDAIKKGLTVGEKAIMSSLKFELEDLAENPNDWDTDAYGDRLRQLAKKQPIEALALQQVKDGEVFPFRRQLENFPYVGDAAAGTWKQINWRKLQILMRKLVQQFEKVARQEVAKEEN